MTKPLKNFLSFICRFGFSALLLWYLSSKIDVQKTVDVLKTADVFRLCCALIIFILLNMVILYRWLIFIRALKLTAETWDVTRYFFIGLFGNLFLPSAVGGDIIKIIGLCQNSTQKPRVVASVLLDRLSGFAGIVIVAIISFMIGYQKINEASLIIPIALMGFGSLTVAAFLFSETIYSFGCRIFNKLPKFKNALMQMHYDIALMKDRKGQGAWAIAISAVNQLILAAVWWLIALALNQDISIIYFFIFVPLICVASSLPSIGGLGVREAGAAYLFTKVGLDPGVAVSVSLINFLFMIFVGLIGGVIYVFTVSSGRLQHHSSNAGEAGNESS